MNYKLNKIVLSQDRIETHIRELRSSLIVSILMFFVLIFGGFFTLFIQDYIMFFCMSLVIILWAIVLIINFVVLCYWNIKDTILNQDKYIRIKKVLDAKIK